MADTFDVQNRSPSFESGAKVNEYSNAHVDNNYYVFSVQKVKEFKPPIWQKSPLGCALALAKGNL